MAGRPQFQYQGIAQPLPSGTVVPPVPALSWSPSYLDRYRRLPALSAAILAGAFFFTPIVGNQQQTAATTGSAQIFPGKQVQYQSQVAPFLPAYTTVVPTLDGWGQPPSQPTYPISRLPALIASGWQGPISPPDIPEPRAQGVIRMDVVRAVPRLLYQDLAEPLFTTPAITLDWLPSYPVQLNRAVPVASLIAFYAEFDSVVPLGHVGWLPTYPNQIDRRQVRAADQGAFFTGQTGSTLPSERYQWRPTYPDRVWGLLRSVEYPAFVAPPFSVRPLGHLGWAPTYPDFARAARRTPDYPARFEPPYSVRNLGHVGWLPEYPDQFLIARRLPEYLAVFTGQTGSTIPITDLRWQASYPERIVRLIAQPHLYPSVWFDPFPPTTVDRLFAWAIYPDRIDRLVLPTSAQQAYASTFHAIIPSTDLRWQSVYPNQIWARILPIALYPFTGPENLDPIPNEGVAGDEKHYLGVVTSLSVTAKPTIGGASGWGTS